MDDRDLITVSEAAASMPWTSGAIYQKIHRGSWIEGKEYHRDPDGRIWISRQGVRQWILGGSPG